ncbi:ester cyclase [Haladaptatus sp. DJG-WS-42]|uniref:ester cyclase n=1 Tax=Haladaptatus sp. DJG-WS-42 TaxID=3120516 RepID=UPI0030D40632
MATIDVLSANKALVRREMQEVWNEDKLDVLDELYAPDVKVGTRRMGDPAPLVALSDIKAVHREWDEGFPDANVRVNELAAEGDVVFAWWTITGTHTGQFRGYKPTGNEIAVDGFSVRKIKDGRVVEMKDSASMTSLLDQIGVQIPPS